jgi:GGDEF domain-containing protein
VRTPERRQGMKLFDRVDSATVERRDVQLTIFSISIIAVLVLAVAILMYPTISSHPVIFSEHTSKVFFFSFCALSLLLLGYLVDRQIVVRRLRREVARAQARYSELHRQAGEDLVGSLAGLNHFQDRLVMEYKRAVNCRDTLTVMVVRLSPTPALSSPAEVTAALGDAVKALSRKLRREDSLYHFSSGIFGILLPGVKAQDARIVASRLGESLNDVAGVINRFAHEEKIFNYPLHAATASELENSVRSLLPGDLVSEPSLAAAYEPITSRKG